jgi:branched-chain amino acid transport system substrate-binding protein
MKMTIDEINAAGGVLGRPLEMVVADTGWNTPSELVAARDALIAADPDVVMTMWWFSSIASQYMLDVGVLMIQQGWVLADWEAAWEYRDVNPYFVFINQGEHGYGAPYFQALTNPEMIPWEFPNNKAAIMMPDFDYAINIATWWREEAEKHGWEIVLFERHPVESIEYGPQFTKIRAEEPAIILFASSFPKELVAAFEEFLKAPTESLFCSIWIIELPEFKGAVGERGNGVIGTLPGVDFMASEYTGQNPQYMTHYLEGKAYAAKYHALYGEPPAISGFIAVDAMNVWVEAVERAGDVRDFDAIMEAMWELDHVGVMGRFGFDPEIQAGHYGADKLPIMYYQMQGGEVHTLAIGAGKDVEIVTPFQLPWWLEE